ncbi:MAG: TROVE domain-containing protein [Bacteroidota bacterium]
MARFNFSTALAKVKNFAGGDAYKQSPELELVSMLVTSFVKDQFYRSQHDGLERLKNLIALCDKEFVAKAAIFARTEFGMRTISHVVASELAKHIGGQVWAKDFYSAVVFRPDDMMEILAYHTATNGKVPNSMKKGFAKAFERFDSYQLGKYRAASKDFKLVDVVNLVHPVPVEKNAEAISALIKDELRSTGTWESALTKTGQTAENDEQKAVFKNEAWTELIRSRKIGYFALLRNLRNIITQAPDVIGEALEMLTNERLIKKSLVLPFRFTTAYEEVLKMDSGKVVREVLQALNTAVDISLNNVPKFDGETLVVLDVSGSMAGKPAEIGSLFSAILVKSNNADFMTFSDDAAYKNVNIGDSTITIARSIKFAMGGTNFHAIFQKAKRKYDRIIILSDMQGWIGNDTPANEFTAYKRRTGADPFVYSFDLQGYGTLQLPQNKVFCTAGFSDKIFDIMKLMETDKASMIEKISSVSFKN